DHRVAVRERDLRMLVLGDTRERGARLTLTAGAEADHLIGRQITVGLHRAEILHAIEIAGLTRDLRDALHRASDHDHLAVGSPCRLRDGPQPADIRGTL